MGALDTAGADVQELGDLAIVRVTRWLLRAARPWLGWLPLGLLVVLNALAAVSISNANWVRQGGSETLLVVMASSAPAVVWLFAGWKRPSEMHRYRFVAYLLVGVASLLFCLLLLSLLAVRWLPPPAVWLESLRAASFEPSLRYTDTALESYFARVALWRVGAQIGGSPGDELIFSTLAGGFLAAIGLVGAALLRQTRQGLLAALPSLFALGGVVFLSGTGRPLFITALAITLAMHVAVDSERLQEQWRRTGLDYSSDLALERWFGAAGLSAVALAVAALAPVVSIDSLATFYARLVEPVDARLEAVRQTAFPNVEVAPRFTIAGTQTGLPNSFLLGSGPELSEELILTVRTSDAGELDAPPEAPYLRASVLDVYDGRGWQSGEVAERVSLPAGILRPVSNSGRRLVAQTVRQHTAATTWFVAGEPVQFGADALLSLDAQGQLITAVRSPTSFTALSAVPAQGDEELAALPTWNMANPLPSGFEAYLELPATVTTRTHALAQQIAGMSLSPYRQAAAIEAYLRTIPYDLDIDEPPATVSDVADWFLFDLRRGYCDYYATAFVVMARSLGLPSRFVVGYAPGDWQPYEQAWRVTAADSHAWPEVYLPEIGWIAFEPTAGRAPLPRLQANAPLQDAEKPAAAPPIAPEPGAPWTWETLTWLIPIGLAAFGLWRLLRRLCEQRTEPWQALQNWGTRWFRPQLEGETPLEYGRALSDAAGTVAEAALAKEETVRSAARLLSAEVPSLARAESALRFAQENDRAAAREAARHHWRLLAPLLPVLRRRLRHK